MILFIKLITEPLLFYLKLLNAVYMIKLMNMLILSKVQCGFRKGFSTQYSLMTVIEKWREKMDKESLCAALLTDQNKVMYNYLTDRKHRTRINDSFSDFIDLLLGVPQGSILGPRLFNIYICDLFFFVEEDNFTGYADDTSPYSNGKNATVLENIERKGKEVFNTRI